MKGEKRMRVEKLTWEEPPARQRGPGGWVSGVLPELRKHKGRWACLKEYRTSNQAGTTAGRLNRTHLEFEFCVRQGKLYGRFVGKGRLVK